MVNEHSSHTPLKLGWIPYWNLWPLKCELDRLYGHSNMQIEKGVPSKVNSLLENGLVDLAPCSSICLVSKPNFEMALPLGVAADGAVQSVYLGFYSEHSQLLERLASRREKLREIFQRARKNFGCDARGIARVVSEEAKRFEPLPLSLVPGLKVSPESASSTVLAKILYKLWFGEEAYSLMADRDVSQKVYTRRPMELLIGDEALNKKRKFHKIIDLGSLWKEMTGLPFVFSVWQSRGACLNGWRRKILEAGKISASRMQIEPAAYLPKTLPVDDQGHILPLADYWKCIYYNLGPRELKGLLIFLCLARRLNLVPVASETIGKIIRWEDLSSRSSLPLM